MIEATSGEVLYEKNADTATLIASTTKIMTAIIVLENCDLDEIIHVTSESIGVEGSSMYLNLEDEYTVRDILYGMLLVSGNDAATALAIHTAGSVEAFADMMNDKAEILDMTTAHFVNPHGLDADGHEASAMDLAKLMQYCMENETFVEISGSSSYNLYGQTYVNHNKLLYLCDGCVAGKTGYTLSAGRSLVSCVERDGIRLICVTISAPDDWNDHATLYDYGFSLCKLYEFTDDDIQDKMLVISGEREYADIYLESNLSYVSTSGEKVEFQVELPSYIFAEVSSGEIIGRVVMTVDGEEIGNANIKTKNTIAVKAGIELSAWEKFKQAWKLAGLPLVAPYYLIGEDDERAIAKDSFGVWYSFET